METRMNLYFPLWIDGGLGRELHAGARALRAYLEPSLDFEELPVDDVCPPALERGIVGYRSIVRHLARARTLLSSRNPARLFTIGGGCGIEVATVGYLLGVYPKLKLLWLDAHGDVNSPASSPSKHFHGMPLRFLLESGLDEGICPDGPALQPAALRYIGARDFDPPERAYIAERGIEHLGPADAGEAGRGWEGESLYVHLDLDVLDPAEYPNVKCPEPEGMRIDEVAALLRGLASAASLVGMSVVENVATESSELSRLEPILEVGRRL
jgi:arginase